MSTTPPEEPTSTPPPTQPHGTYTGIGRSPVSGAILPVPGNAELAVYFVILVFLIVIWAVSDQVDAGLFSILLTILTSLYLLSRGIAKASRVLEQ